MPDVHRHQASEAGQWPRLIVVSLVGGSLLVAGAFLVPRAPGRLLTTAVSGPACAQGLGDVNVDANVDSHDVTILEDVVAGLVVPGTAPFTAPASVGDLNEDAAITLADARLLQGFLDGSVACLPLSGIVNGTCPVACVANTVPTLALAGPSSLNADGTSTITLTAQLSNYPSLGDTTSVEGLGISFSASSEYGFEFTPLVALTDAWGKATVQVRAASRTGATLARITAREEQFATSGWLDVLLTGTAVSSPPPSGVARTLHVEVIAPLEGRLATTGGIHGTSRTTSLAVALHGPGIPERVPGEPFVLITGLTTDAEGRVAFDVPNTTVTDGTTLTVGMKSGQSLGRLVRAQVTSAGLVADLRTDAIARSRPASPLNGLRFLPAGDVDGSGDPVLHDNRVDATDIGAWIQAFRKTDPTILADLDGNSSVGAEDLSLILRNFNTRGDDETIGGLATAVSGEG